MSVVSRPASVRELLDCLPRSTLVYLCDLRALHVSRANDECRSRIARSFRGQRDDFLSMLRKDELVMLLQMPIRDGDVIFTLPSPEQYTKRELLDLAISSFGRTRELGRPFVRSESVPLSARSVASPSGGSEKLSSSEGAVTAGPERDASVAPVSTRAGTPGSGWSRPRPIRTLFSQVGLTVPTSVSHEEFAALVEALENRGYELATTDGMRVTPLHDPLGLDDEVRLRHDAFAMPVGVHAGAGVGTAATAGPGALPPELGDYARASLRLELLMAGFGGAASDRLVDDCVEAAVAGLPIDPSGRALLGAVARALVRERREPFSVLTHLVARIDSEDGEVLLREYCAIHRPGDEMRNLLFDHWSALTRGPSSSREVPVDLESAPLVNDEQAHDTIAMSARPS